MSCLGQALSNLKVIRDFAYAGVGMVALQDRDAIGGAADYILMREDIDTVLVYGIVDDRVDGSLRTNSPSVDPAVVLASAEPFGSIDWPEAPDGDFVLLLARRECDGTLSLIAASGDADPATGRYMTQVARRTR